MPMRLSHPPVRDAQQQRQVLQSLRDEANKGAGILEQSKFVETSFFLDATGDVARSDTEQSSVLSEAIAILQSRLSTQRASKIDRLDDSLPVPSRPPQIAPHAGDQPTPPITTFDVNALGDEISASITTAFEQGIASLKLEQEHFLEQIHRASETSNRAHFHTDHTRRTSTSRRDGDSVFQRSMTSNETENRYSENRPSQHHQKQMLPKSVQEAMDRAKQEAKDSKTSNGDSSKARRSKTPTARGSKHRDGAPRATYHLGLMNQQLDMQNRQAGSFGRFKSICPDIDTSMFTILVRSRQFDLGCSFVMLAFAIIVGVESDLKMTAALQNRALPKWPFFTDIGFNVFFAIEVTLRLLGERSDFFFGKDWNWNMFDLFLAVLSIIDMLGQSIKLTFFRLFRTMKVLKALKVVRMVRWFHELRVMLTSVMASLASLCWTMIFLAMTTFLTSVALLQGLTDYIEDQPDDPNAHKSKARIDIERFFPSISESMYTLLAAITGGIDWMDPAYPCWRAGMFYGQVLMLFVLVSILGILNVVTSMFVERTASLKKMDRDFAIAEEVAQMKSDMKETLALFKVLDPDGEEVVTRDALLEFLKEDQIIAHFSTIGIDVSDQTRIVALLDENLDGSIGLVEFVSGCIALKGSSNKADAMMTANILMEMREVLDIVHDEVRSMRRVIFPLKGTRTMTVASAQSERRSRSPSISTAVDPEKAPDD